MNMSEGEKKAWEEAERAQKLVGLLMFLLFAVPTLVCGTGYIFAQEKVVKLGKYDAGEQIVMALNNTKPDGTKVVIVKEVIPILTLVDAEDQHSAPQSNGSNLICRELYEYKNSKGESRLAFQCGSDTYIVRDIALVPKKDVKKNVVGMEEK